MDQFEASDVLEQRESLVLPARIVTGLGVARRCLALQLPLIARHFPEVKNCHPGTINVRFDEPLTVVSPDHRTTPLQWIAHGRGIEVFDILRIELELAHERPPQRAWLYLPHSSPHRGNPWMHEVIAPRMDLRGTHRCRIRVSPDAVRWGTPSGERFHW